MGLIVNSPKVQQECWLRALVSPMIMWSIGGCKENYLTKAVSWVSNTILTINTNNCCCWLTWGKMTVMGSVLPYKTELRYQFSTLRQVVLIFLNAKNSLPTLRMHAEKSQSPEKFIIFAWELYNKHYVPHTSQWTTNFIAAVLTLQNEVQFILTTEVNKLFQTGAFKHWDNAWPWIVEVNWLLPFVKILY
jgi:hypothetical protein